MGELVYEALSNPSQSSFLSLWSFPLSLFFVVI